MKVAIIQKILLSLTLISLTFPFIFQKKTVHHYRFDMPDMEFTLPRLELFGITVGFLILWVLTELWEKELKQLFNEPIEDETE
jgi:Na+(H+)/acetate symporter ActP